MFFASSTILAVLIKIFIFNLSIMYVKDFLQLNSTICNKKTKYDMKIVKYVLNSVKC